MTADFPGANRSGGAIRHAGKPHPLLISAFTPLCRHCLARPFYRPFSALPHPPPEAPAEADAYFSFHKRTLLDKIAYSSKMKKTLNELTMKNESIGIAKEGYPVIALLAVTAVIFAIFQCYLGALLFLALLWFSVYFFRDPERVVPSAENIAVSPADGKIIRIQKKQDPVSGEEKTCISIFMNLFSVHVNRSPVSGTLQKIAYFPGKFLNASFDKASTDNERCAYLVTDGQDKSWVFVQISGLIARRIVCRADEGDTLKRGQRFGLIRFGSRVDLYIPDEYESAVKIGEQVFAGQSVIAKKQG